MIPQVQTLMKQDRQGEGKREEIQQPAYELMLDPYFDLFCGI